MSRAAATLAALVLLGTQGCMAETRSGDLTVSWTIGLDDPTEDQCTGAGIESILVSVTSSEFTDSEETTCTDGRRTLHGLPVSNYTVRVQGMDAAGCAVYQGTLADVVPTTDEDHPETEIIMQRVTPGGSVAISWRFEDGMVCGAHGVEEVHLQLLSDDAMVLEDDFACDAGMVEVTDVPAGSIDLRLSGLEGPVEQCYVATNLALEPCDLLSVEALLEPCI
jgi:hypothetical protein